MQREFVGHVGRDGGAYDIYIHLKCGSLILELQPSESDYTVKIESLDAVQRLLNRLKNETAEIGLLNRAVEEFRAFSVFIE